MPSIGDTVTSYWLLTFLCLLPFDLGDNAVHGLCNVEGQEQVAEPCGALFQATGQGT